MSFFKAWLRRESLRFRLRALKARFRDQTAEFEVISRHLRPGDIACDIGANKGSFIPWLSRWCGTGRVVAFEPQPEFARRLAEVCRATGLDNVTVEAKAVYSHSGQQELFVPAGHSPGASLTHRAAEAKSFTTLSVPLVSLDDYFDANEKIALLKIDVEGAELGVFKGAERILRQHAPLWFSNARTAISRPAMSAMYFPILRDWATRAASSAAIRCCRSPNSMPPCISARTANGSSSARITATILSFAKRRAAELSSCPLSFRACAKWRIPE